ncbi:MAG TPA: RDD family protein [Bryobacteraceae bacterium]|nr:RDD family protein [Bryobacteraceae bacterium]
MTCSYCRYLNSDDERRCRRCGRPQYDVYAMATSGSLAAVPKPVPSQPAAPAVAPAVAQPAQPAGVPRQAMLFPDRPSGKVIPFDGNYEPPAPPRPRTVTRTSTRVTRRPAAPNTAQPSLEFLQPAPPAPRKLSTTVEAVIDCDAPVAAPMHRACAAVIDGSMILIGCGLFLTVFYLSGGSFPSTKPVMLVMGAAAALIAMFYGFVWVCAGGQTPGMRALRLTLINFDGYPPDRTARWLRYLGACLGYCAGGLGLLWALLDEESLAWHDHISKTFPTFHGPETNFVRRR